MITKFIIALMLFFNLNTASVPAKPGKPGYSKPNKETFSKPNKGEGEKSIINDDVNP